MGNLAHAIGNGRIFAGALRALRVRLPRQRPPEAGPDGPSEAEGDPRRSFLDRLRTLSQRGWLALALAGVASAILVGTVLAAGTTFTVNSTGDGADANPGDGVCDTAAAGTECTLRAAIGQANNTSTNRGPDTINFNIPVSDPNRNAAGVFTITPHSPLPVITDPVTIDGYSQGDGTADDATPNMMAIGNDARLLIELSGGSVSEHATPQNPFPAPAVGLYLSAGSERSTVRGLVINSFLREGIRIAQANSVVEGNFIGTDASGTLPRGNLDGVVSNRSGNTLGGETPGARNVISGNQGNGVFITGGDNTVQGNYIGTDASGTQDLGNSSSGMFLQDRGGNTIGGTSEGARNVISANNGPGVSIRASTLDFLGNTVQGNYIGTDANGSAPLGNSLHGVFLNSGNGNTIGGTTAAARNVISANGSGGAGSGVFIQGAHIDIPIMADFGGDNTVQGNYIGTDKDGALPLGNNFRGVVISNAKDNTIGGAEAGAGNIISANNISGVFIGKTADVTGDSTGNKVQGNYVGIDKNGTRSDSALDLGNNGPGVDLDTGSSNNTIGGTAAAARNVISDNQGDGVFISSSGNQVQGNYVGTDKEGARPAGAPDLGNSNTGVNIGSQGANNTIGGATTGARNVISDNGFNGIGISGSSNQVQGNYIGTDASGAADLGNSFDGVSVSGTSNSILSNSIFSNGGTSSANLGIDLGNDGVTQNDAGDGDFGANNLQNFPVLAPFTSSGGTTTIKGTLKSTPSKTFTVQFFSSPEADPSGYGEGKNFLGETNVTTDGNGDAGFTFTASTSLSTTDVVTATATNQSTNDTSEFSEAQNANNAPSVTLSGPSTANEGETKSYTFTVTDPDSGDSFTLKSGFPDCGTGGQLVSSPSTTASGGSFECSFADGPASPEVRVQVTDSNNADSNIATQPVTVTNANPTISSVSPGTVDEGSSSTITVTAIDPAGTSDPLSYEFDCDNNGTYEIGPQTGNTAQCTFTDSGTFKVNVRVTDGDGGEDTDSTTVDVNNVAPTVTLSGLTTANEGDTKTYTFTVTDPGTSDTQTITAGCGANGEKVTGSDAYDQASGNGSFKCRFPDGPATSDVTVKATDSDGASDTDNRRVTVTVANVAPTVTLSGPTTTNEGETKSYTYTLSDPGNDPNPTITESCGANATRTDTPATHSFDCTFPDGPASSTVSVSADDGTDTATDSLSVAISNASPVAQDDSYTTNEDQTLSKTAPGVLTNDSDAGSDTLTALKVDGPSHGSLTLDTDGSFTYTPNSNFNGSDSFTYKATDSDSADSNTATVSITVNSANDAPDAKDDSYSVNEDGTLTETSSSGVLKNDTDLDSDTLSVAQPRPVSGPSHGTLTLNSEGSFSYTPNSNFNGSDSFTYKATDGNGGEDTATVTITVNPANDAPVANNQSATTNEDTSKVIALSGTDTDGNNLSFNFSSSPTHGTLSSIGTPTCTGAAPRTCQANVTYKPNANFSGTDSFKFRVNDGTTNSSEATVSITVRAVNDAPVAKNDLYVTNEDQTLSVRAPAILINDTDPEKTKLSAKLVANPKQGTLKLNPNGSFSYKPKANFNGVDTFSYKASDGTALSNTATVKITVRPVPG
jgi:CSLREA domain-containing protein